MNVLKTRIVEEEVRKAKSEYDELEGRILKRIQQRLDAEELIAIADEEPGRKALNTYTLNFESNMRDNFVIGTINYTVSWLCKISYYVLNEKEFTCRDIYNISEKLGLQYSRNQIRSSMNNMSTDTNSCPSFFLKTVD